MRLVKSLLSRRAFENHTVAPVLLPPCTCRRSAQFSSRSTSAEIPSAPSSISALDTIFAPATGRSKSAISILRISGPKAVDIYHAVTTLPRSAISRSRTASSLSPPTPRRALLRRIIHPRTRETLDEGIVLYFPAHQALTGQPTLELHMHGSPALLNLMIELLPSVAKGVRIAEPGEFTQLAFLAGKMDLTAVEGLRDLVDAETEQQRRLASRQAEGHMQRAFDAMRMEILQAAALVEALIDFGEDQGIDEHVWYEAQDRVRNLATSIDEQLLKDRRGEIIRQGIQLAIIGAPNAGKSSLLNWLAQREAAIVTSLPGTTRDVVSLDLDYHGFPLSVADTAGLRPTEAASDEVERIGIERAIQRAQQADIKLAVLSAPAVLGHGSGRTQVQVDEQTLGLIDKNTLVLVNKMDEIQGEDALETSGKATQEALQLIEQYLRDKNRKWIGSEHGRAVHPISVKTGAGLRNMSESLKKVLKEKFEMTDDIDQTPLVTSVRHRRHLEDCYSALLAFLEHDASDIVMAAEELRYAVLALGRITGAIDVEEVLGEIFAGFCIGK